MKRCVLVETETDVGEILKHYGPTEHQWVALSPLCIPLLHKQMIVHIALDDVIEPNNTFSEINDYTEKAINNLISTVDGWVKANHADFRNYDLSLLEYYRYYLTILFDGICLRLLYLDHFLSSAVIDEIIIHKTKIAENNSSAIVPWSKEDTVWAYCVEFLLKNRYSSTKLTTIETSGCEEGAANDKRTVYEKAQKVFPRVYHALKTLKDRGMKTAVLNFFNDNLILLNDKQWKYAAPYLNSYGYNIVPQSIKNARSDSKSKIEYVNQLSLTEYFNYKGMDLAELIGDKINTCIHHGITNFTRMYTESEKMLDLWKPQAILFSVIDRPKDWVTLHAAKRRGCPIIAWGHGASGQASFTKQYRDELLLCDYYFTQGAGSQKTYETYIEHPFVSKPIGFPILDDLYAKLAGLKSTEKIYEVIYAPTNYYKNNFYFSFYPGVIDHKLYEVHEKIISFLKIQKCRSLLKIGYGNYFEKFFVYAFGNSLEIESSKPLTELIPYGNAFIIDLPTTTLIEVLCTEKPVFVLTQFIKLTEHAERLLKKRAICCETVDKLIQALDTFMVRGEYPADLKNQEYLCAYGTYMNDGQSAKRGADAVLDILRSRKSGMLSS